VCADQGGGDGGYCYSYPCDPFLYWRPL